MLQGWIIVLVSLAYIGLLFAIARYGDKRADAKRSLINNPYIYALSLGVYCTAWTYYGSVGRAASSGVGFLPIYLGPTLMFTIGWFVLRKMIRISKVNRITSIADFIASRYGKSTALGSLVTIVAVIGIIPYISLQLKGISTSYNVMLSYPDIVMPTYIYVPVVQDTAFYIALLLAAFTILFGTRHLEVTEHHEGLVMAIAFESVVKLVAFLAVGIFVTFGVYNGFGDVFAKAAEKAELRSLFAMTDTYGYWAWLTFLSMMAIFLLPRQFQMTVVENIKEHHLDKSIWLFPLYLLFINIFVLPIAFGGLLHFPNGGIDPDTFVLTVPMAEGQELLTLLVFIGGLSAATSMVIVATIAMTTMISNDLIMPILLHWRVLDLSEDSDLGWLLLTIRRLSIILILLLSYGYFRLTGESQALVSIGLTSFAAVAQFAPAILGGIYWKGAGRLGAFVGLIAGFVVWSYTLLFPSLADSGFLSQDFVENGMFGLGLFRPYALFGLEGLNPVVHAMMWSMLANVGAFVTVSLLSKPTVLDHSQATLFVDVFKISSEGDRARFWRGNASTEALCSLLGRFLGPNRADALFEDYARQRNVDLAQQPLADAELVDFVETQLAGAIGAASARAMVASVVQEEPLSISEVMNILDETSQVIAYSHKLEQQSRELEQATAELRAANERLKELDRLKDDFMSTVTHELRTPLTSIRAFSEILHDNVDLDPEQRSHFAGIIVKESERLTRLINNVLDLSKIESGKMEWDLSQLDIKEVIEEALLISTGQLSSERNIEFEVDLADDIPPVMADRDRIMQVMLNLLSNAIKFCDNENGWVGVFYYSRGDHLRVDVADNGPGIRPEDHDIVFEKFRQVGDTLTDKPQGTGLGLPICRHIITHFGGELWAESEPGHGATFSFTFPLESGKVKEEQEDLLLADADSVSD